MRANYLPILEKDIEDPVVLYYKKLYKQLHPMKGALVRKMNGQGYRSWSDRLFLGPWGRILWVEFKKPGEKPTELQLIHHQDMKNMGHQVLVVDNVLIGKRLIEALFGDVCAACGQSIPGLYYYIELCNLCQAMYDVNTMDWDLVEVPEPRIA